MTESLGTVQGLAERRGVDFDPTDVRAIRALQDASAFIRRYTGQAITPVVTDDEVILDGRGRDGLLLPELPVLTITEVTEIDWDGTAEILDATDYVVDRSGILYRRDGWIWRYGHQNVGVTYDHGYEDVPDHYAAACYELAAINYVTQGTGAVTSETIGGYSVTYDASTVGTAEIPMTVKELLRRVPQ